MWHANEQGGGSAAFIKVCFYSSGVSLSLPRPKPPLDAFRGGHMKATASATACEMDDGWRWARGRRRGNGLEPYLGWNRAVESWSR